jgi:hypothetical protein
MMILSQYHIFELDKINIYSVPIEEKQEKRKSGLKTVPASYFHLFQRNTHLSTPIFFSRILISLQIPVGKLIQIISEIQYVLGGIRRLLYVFIRSKIFKKSYLKLLFSSSQKVLNRYYNVGMISKALYSQFGPMTAYEANRKLYRKTKFYHEY